MSRRSIRSRLAWFRSGVTGTHRARVFGVLLATALLASLTSCLALADDKADLLARFRKEFIDLVPGQAGKPRSFSMGRAGGEPAEAPPHRVMINYPFAIARYEVTQGLWQAVMGENPSRWKGPNNSVEMLSYDEAVEFCAKVTKLLREAQLIPLGEVVRLPSEAEWEYAARAGSDTLYSFGDDSKELGDYAWSTHNAAGNDPPVGAKKPNAWNLYDMHGYLWEWCADTWHNNYQGAPTDGSAWTMHGEPMRHVLRSGSWKDPAPRLTSSYRRPADRALRDDAVGLRCVLSAEVPSR